MKEPPQSSALVLDAYVRFIMGNKISAVNGVKSPNFFEQGNAVNEIWVGDLEIISRLPFGDSDMAQAGWPKGDYPKIPWRPFIIPLRADFQAGDSMNSTTTHLRQTRDIQHNPGCTLEQVASIELLLLLLIPAFILVWIAIVISIDLRSCLTSQLSDIENRDTENKPFRENRRINGRERVRMTLLLTLFSKIIILAVTDVLGEMEIRHHLGAVIATPVSTIGTLNTMRIMGLYNKRPANHSTDRDPGGGFLIWAMYSADVVCQAVVSYRVCRWYAAGH
ncbi:hypothetical protein FQN57_000525 [Myotisia sp. PD_48]|nr:hypothetical protein FQN57_000525 [Myotisia sp. PD_48]